MCNHLETEKAHEHPLPPLFISSLSELVLQLTNLITCQSKHRSECSLKPRSRTCPLRQSLASRPNYNIPLIKTELRFVWNKMEMALKIFPTEWVDKSVYHNCKIWWVLPFSFPSKPCVLPFTPWFVEPFLLFTIESLSMLGVMFSVSSLL